VKTVYCICGLGSDERIFSKLNWGDKNVHYLHWLMPRSGEDIAAYAQRMSERITEKEAILVGVSFGGILCIEIAKLINVQKVILISSVKTHHEMPRWMKASGKLSLDAIIPRGRLHALRPLKLFSPVENYFLGAVTEEEKKLAHEYRKNIDPHYLKWSIHQVLNWKNEWIPENLFHLHGSNDKIFPCTLVHPTHTVASAGHFLVFQHPKEVSVILNDII
jgi:pimeloyl-ACP methyl ester carboxylesterase